MLTLCRVTTADGLKLDGSLERPDRPISQRRCALLLIHGTGSNFYGSGVFASLATEAINDGHAVLRINTRGHDLAASISGPKGPVRGGAAYEHVLDCHHDVTTWCNFLIENGRDDIVLIGHSLGGVKAFWSQKLAPHPAVHGIVGISPPRFVHQKFQSDLRCEAFRRDFATAQWLVAEGQGETLITVTQPMPIIITAAGYLEKYGPGDPLDYVPVLPTIPGPKLLIVGSQTVESNPAFDGLPAAVQAVAATDPNLAFEVIDGADINYRNDPAEPWRRIRRWMAD